MIAACYPPHCNLKHRVRATLCGGQRYSNATEEGIMGKHARYLIFVFILSFMIGCATRLVVDYDYDTTYDFTKLKTYDWLPSPPGSQVEDLTEKRLMSAVDTQLAAKGYGRSTDAPDFLISLQGIKKTVESGSVGVGTSIGVPVGGRGSMSVGVGKSKPRVKQEGTLVMDFIDRQANAKIWEGTATAAIQPKSSPEEQQQRINEIIAQLLSHFPPQPTKK